MDKGDNVQVGKMLQREKDILSNTQMRQKNKNKNKPLYCRQTKHWEQSAVTEQLVS